MASEGERILSANLLSGKRGGAENHAACKKSSRCGKEIERGERGAARGAQDSVVSRKAAGKKIGDAYRRAGIKPAPRCETRERRRRARIRSGGEEACELPGVAQPEV